MKIIEVNYTRKFNLGNYETEDISFVATVDADEDPDEVIQKLRQKTIDLKIHAQKVASDTMAKKTSVDDKGETKKVKEVATI